MQKYIYIFFQKNSFKKIQNPSRYYYNYIITNLNFQHKPGKISSFKNPHINKKIKNRPIIESHNQGFFLINIFIFIFI
jgi:hypothetical protein